MASNDHHYISSGDSDEDDEEINRLKSAVDPNFEIGKFFGCALITSSKARNEVIN